MIGFYTHPRSLSKRLAKALGLAALLAGPALAPLTAEDSVEGYRYVLYNANVEPEELEGDPAEIDGSAQYVTQGPEWTVMRYSVEAESLRGARFATGELRFGLFVPYWKEGQSAADETGWSSYGTPVSYKSFNLRVRPGEQDREIDGRQASHYVVEADFTTRSEGEDVWAHTTLTSDIWALEDKSFSLAPFATAGAYGDPRLTVALFERLSELGLVVRVETRHERRYQEDDGTEVGHPRDGVHVAWVTEFESAEVTDLNLPRASEATVDALRTALRANADAACESALAGETPAFAKELLDEEQQAGFFSYLEARCEERASRDG